MYKSGSTKLVKNLNKNHILNLVRLNPGVTARAISDETGLQISTVLYTLKALEGEGLINNLGFGNTTFQGGKPPVMWGIAADYGVIIGIELSSREMRIVAADFAGKILIKEIQALEFSTSHLMIVHQISKVIESVVKGDKLKGKNILGVGIGVPGSVDSEKGIINYSYSFDFHGVRFKALLEKQIKYHLEIDNDANAGAMGVKLLHKDFQSTQHLLYISINQKFSGAGVGFIINNQIYRGSNGAAGEIQSLFTSNATDRLLERALKKDPANKLIKKFVKNKDEYHLSELVEDAAAGKAGSIFILRELGKEISKTIIQLTNLFDPQVIVIGGDICEAGDIILPVIRERLKHGVISETARDVPVCFSEYKQFSGAAGAASLIFDRIFNKI